MYSVSHSQFVFFVVVCFGKPVGVVPRPIGPWKGRSSVHCPFFKKANVQCPFFRRVNVHFSHNTNVPVKFSEMECPFLCTSNSSLANHIVVVPKCYVPISSTQTEKYEYHCFYAMYLFSPIHIYIQCTNDISYAASSFSTKYLLPLLSVLIDPKYAVVPSCLFPSLVHVCDDNLQPHNDVVVHSVSCTCR